MPATRRSRTRGGRVEKFREPYSNSHKSLYISKAANAKGWWTKETKCENENAEIGCKTNAVVYANGGRRKNRKTRRQTRR